jgi:hypothetical protein
MRRHVLRTRGGVLPCSPDVPTGMIAGRRFQGLGLHPFGSLTPWLGFVSPDIECREANEVTSGRSRRGLFAKTTMHYDKVLMRFPALTYYVGDEQMQEQCREMTRWVLTKMAAELDEDDKPFTAYVQHRLRNLQPGSHVVFASEEDVVRFMTEIPKGNQLVKREVLTTKDVHNLAMQIEWNRFHMLYDGRNGVALFPEAAIFNHTCEPNVELTFQMNLNKEYVVEARALKPIMKGDQLFVNYIPSNTLPLSRFAMAMRDRWGFECQCAECKSRVLCATAFIAVFVMLPILGPIFYFTISRQTSNARKAGFI